MRKIVYSAIGTMALICLGVIAVGDPIDNFAQALRTIIQPKGVPGGELSGSDEGRRAALDDFFVTYPNFEKRIDALIIEWDASEKKGAPKQEQTEIAEKTFGTFVRAVDDGARGIAIFIHDGIVFVFSNDNLLAQIPLERIVDACHLSLHFFKKILSESYSKNWSKLYWVGKCRQLSKEKRATVTAGGEKVCVNSGCLTRRECAIAQLHYFAEVMEPWSQLLAEGIDVYGRHIDGISDILADFARMVGKTDTEKNQISKYIKDKAKILKLVVKASRTMEKRMAKLKVGVKKATKKGSK